MRNTVEKLVIQIFAGLILCLVLASCGGSSGGSSRSSYQKIDRGPYGDKYFYDLIDDIFDSLSYTRKAIEDNLYGSYYLREDPPGNMIFVTHSFDTEGEDLKLLLDHVASGYTVLIAAEDFESDLLDSLDCDVYTPWGAVLNAEEINIVDDTLVSMNLFLDDGDSIYFSFPSFFVPSFFSVDEEYAYVISTLENGSPNTVMYNYGEGSIILCSTPEMFTNMGVLYEDNYVFTSCVMSLFPKDEPIIWDEFYKPFSRQRRQSSSSGSGGDGSGGSGTPDTKSDFDFILKQPPLKWAFYMALFLFAIFLIIGGKRKQRMITTWDKKVNSSVEFTKIVAQLYYQRSDNADTSDKLITYFLEYIRNSFFVKTTHLTDPSFINKVAVRSGVDEREVQRLFQLVSSVRKREKVAEEELIHLNTLIEKFKAKSLV